MIDNFKEIYEFLIKNGIYAIPIPIIILITHVLKKNIYEILVYKKIITLITAWVLTMISTLIIILIFKQGILQYFNSCLFNAAISFLIVSNSDTIIDFINKKLNKEVIK